ncbi:MAG: OmpA family protein [Flavobacteriales bacterium]|nr:OmpA family protein [Flavobacteriales bacterium]MBL6873192.1 OmpA family protein [Flavobacteriales bacterium]
MKNLTIVFLLLLGSLSSYAQTRSSQFNSFSVGADFLSSNIFLGDIKQHDFYPSRVGNFNEFRFSGAVNVKKMFNNVYGLQAEVGIGKLAGIRRAFGSCDYCTSSDYSASLDSESTKFLAHYTNFDGSLLLNLSNFVLNTSKLKPSKFTVLGEFGAGLMSFRSVHRKISNNEVLGYRGYESSDLENKDLQTEAYVKAATHVLFKINDRFDFAAKIKYYLINSDYIDVAQNSGRRDLLASKDKFMSFSLGLNYSLGSKKKSVLWYNPLNEVYHTQKRIAQKVQKMSKDTDEDGVADYFDKDNETPEGVSVDGSGVPMDVDNDGVFDYQDKDLFTARNAKVNSDGVEIDTDGDGVPDSRDLENSVKGAIVNYQGIEVSKKSSANSSSTVLPSIFFSTASTKIRSEDFKRLAIAAKIMNENEGDKYFVVGHADNRGTVDFNLELAKERAENAIRYLVDVFGVDADRFEVVSKGETSPLLLKSNFSADSENGGYNLEDYMNEVNRRVDFIKK